MGGAATHAGVLASGSRYLIEVPRQWNGVAVLCSRPEPVGPDEPPWSADPLIDCLVDHGYAVAGSTNTIFWPLERAFSDQPALLDVLTGVVGSPRAVGVQNAELDMGFVVKTLLAPDPGLQLVGITDPFANLELARTVLQEAQGTAEGRARLALAAAVGNIPGWHDPASARPALDDFAAHQRNQFAWFRDVSFLVLFWAREQMERQAGGNPSWNTGVDYGELLATSVNREEAEALYAAAGLDLGRDLERLAAEPRIDADPAAVAYLERHIVLSGDLGGVPVLTVHTDGDGLVTPDNERAYAEVVSHAGQQDLLRQIYVHRGGHCTFTLAEILTALDVLIQRIERATWPRLDPQALNDAATALGADSNRLRSGDRMEARFFDFEPPPFRRRHDVRDIGSRPGYP